MPRTNPVRNRPSSEANIESTSSLEEQVKDHERVVIQLKRTRNSLLAISKLPPEVLGGIFRWSVIPESDFDGLDEGSHSFLFVCHHWSEVALGTPEVWSFWGNTPTDWARWCHHSATAPLDLILRVDEDGPLNDAVQNALRDRANRDAIRLVHLSSLDAELISSVISSLTVNCEGLRPNGVESFLLYNYGDTSPDLSEFFAHYRFQKLQRLELSDCSFSSWDHLSSQTGVLTTLNLDLGYPSPPPTISQLLSILASNPTLRKVSLSRGVVPHNGGGKSSFRVSLHHLKELELAGDLQDVFGLLHQLDHPRNMENLAASLHNCTVADISQIIGPYLRNYIRRRERPQNRLGLFVSWYEQCIRNRVEDVRRSDSSTVAKQVAWSVTVDISFDVPLPRDMLEKAFLDLIAHIPREEIVDLQACWVLMAMEEISAQFANLTALYLHEIPPPVLFPKSNPGGVFPSLKRVFLGRPAVNDGDWSPLVTSLVRRAAYGNRLDTLEISDSPHMCAKVANGIRSVVRRFRIRRPVPGLCPFGTCPK